MGEQFRSGSSSEKNSLERKSKSRRSSKKEEKST